MLRAIDQLATCVAEQGAATSATRLFGAGARIRELLGTPVDVVLAAEHDRALNTAQTTLGNSFAASWTAGWELPLAALVREACTLTAVAAPAGPGALSSATPSGSLTRREREVLRLLVAGQSDRAIADELYIGRRTVETHVAGILNKLGLGSRTAAAAYAVRFGLV
jgi:DNA-binding CsgD family transcriptional regulator